MWVRKTGIDFGNGSGNWKLVGSGSTASPKLYRQQSITSVPGVTIPSIPTPPSIIRPALPTPPTITPPTLPPITVQCIGTIELTKPDFTRTSIPVSVKVTGDRTSVPMRILVDNREISRQSTPYYSFNVINVLSTARVDTNSYHTITVESTATDCSISPATLSVPPLKPIEPTLPFQPIEPTLPQPIEIKSCTQIMTTVDSLNHPSGITDLSATFYIYMRGIKEVCKSDPNNPEFIKKIPKGTTGNITLGNKSINFFLTDDGIADIDLSKMINLSSISGLESLSGICEQIPITTPTPPTPLPEPVRLPEPPKVITPVNVITWGGGKPGYGSGTYRNIYLNGKKWGTIQIPNSFAGRDEEYLQQQYNPLGYKTQSQVTEEQKQEAFKLAADKEAARIAAAEAHRREQAELLAAFKSRNP